MMQLVVYPALRDRFGLLLRQQINGK